MCRTNKAYEKDDSSKFYFLGIIPKRYIQTYIGLLHVITSLLALILGNYLFLQCIILGRRNINNNLQNISTVFFISTLLSGLSLLPFWSKVQSWQLSTTSIEDKGLTPTQMQNFNRGRGVISMIITSIYPLLYRYAREEVLKDVVVSTLVGGSMTLVCYYQYILIRDYGKVLFIIYGGSRLGYSIHLLWTGSLYNLQLDYPYALEYLEKEAILVVSCVEFGFMWYYLYSRKLIGKEFVKEACKRYHPTIFLIFVIRLLISDTWWKHLPLSMSWVMIMNTLLAGLFLSKMAKSLVGAGGASQVKEKAEGAVSKANNEKRNALRRSSSIFDVRSELTKRPSSIFESINS